MSCSFCAVYPFHTPSTLDWAIFPEAVVIYSFVCTVPANCWASWICCPLGFYRKSMFESFELYCKRNIRLLSLGIRPQKRMHLITKINYYTYFYQWFLGQTASFSNPDDLVDILRALAALSISFVFRIYRHFYFHPLQWLSF